MHHVGDVKASCSNSCSNQDWHPPSLEVFQRLERKFKRNFQKLPRYHNTKSSTCSLSLWSLSPWILVAGKPWYDRIVHLYHQTPRIPYSCYCFVTKSALWRYLGNQAWYHRSAGVKTTGKKFWIRKFKIQKKKMSKMVKNGQKWSKMVKMVKMV